VEIQTANQETRSDIPSTPARTTPEENVIAQSGERQVVESLQIAAEYGQSVKAQVSQVICDVSDSEVQVTGQKSEAEVHKTAQCPPRTAARVGARVSPATRRRSECESAVARTGVCPYHVSPIACMSTSVSGLTVEDKSSYFRSRQLAYCKRQRKLERAEERHQTNEERASRIDRQEEPSSLSAAPSSARGEKQLSLGREEASTVRVKPKSRRRPLSQEEEPEEATKVRKQGGANLADPSLRERIEEGNRRIAVRQVERRASRENTLSKLRAQWRAQDEVEKALEEEWIRVAERGEEPEYLTPSGSCADEEEEVVEESEYGSSCEGKSASLSETSSKSEVTTPSGSRSIGETGAEYAIRHSLALDRKSVV
jgi:hypothetical protein